jgi:hypothetical protein
MGRMDVGQTAQSDSNDSNTTESSVNEPIKLINNEDASGRLIGQMIGRGTALLTGLITDQYTQSAINYLSKRVQSSHELVQSEHFGAN